MGRSNKNVKKAAPAQPVDEITNDTVVTPTEPEVSADVEPEPTEPEVSADVEPGLYIAEGRSICCGRGVLDSTDGKLREGDVPEGNVQRLIDKGILVEK